jgi:8-amino-7-oxononanoate synthase
MLAREEAVTGEPREPRGPSALMRAATSLERLARRDRLRGLVAAAGIDLTSNDYLALAAAPELRDAVREALDRGVPTGAGGSRLLRGSHSEHEALEAEAARFFGAETALFFGSGYAANVALFSTLPRSGDLVVHDALIHASVRDGVKAGRAEAIETRHNDPAAAEAAILAWRRQGGRGCVWLAVESLYSMDGDLAPLDAYAALAARHDAVLVVDEAHATGVHGPGGRGLAAGLEGRGEVITLHTCGKALGAGGALVLAARRFRDLLVNRARPFIYATAPSPLLAAVVRRSLAVVERQPERRERLADLVRFANEHLARRLGLMPTGTQILPVMIGDVARAVRLSETLRARGYDLRAIRPPTVPEGTARLRIAITLHVSPPVIAELADTLAEAMA